MCFTFYYTLRIVRYIITESSYSSPYFLCHSYVSLHLLLLTLLSISSFLFPWLYFSSDMIYSLLSPSLIHSLPLLLLLSSLIVFPYHSTSPLPRLMTIERRSFFSSMLYMFSLYRRGVSLVWLKFSKSSVRAIETGFVSSLLLQFPPSILIVFGSYSSRFSYKLFTFCIFSMVVIISLYLFLWVSALGKLSFES